MMPGLRYPVDRYLVESSNKFERANIIDDNLWVSEPALKPEDEIMLRKLHDMLQSTTNDLKILSGELSKYQEPGVKVKSAPMPLNDEFNEKVHIEELVNAKFHGCKLIDKHRVGFDRNVINNVSGLTRNSINVTKNKLNLKPKVSTSVQVNTIAENKQKRVNRNLGFSKTKLIQIEDTKGKKLNNDKIMKETAPTVAYNEVSYKYEEKVNNCENQRSLQLQKMPSINIRSELKEQKVFNLSITPQDADAIPFPTNKSNTTVVSIKHTDLIKPEVDQPHNSQPKSIRKIYKMSTYESSESSNNLNIDLKTRQNKNTVRNSAITTSRGSPYQKKTVRRDSEKRCYADLEEWKRKLNRVYGGNVSKNDKSTTKHKLNKKKISPDKPKVNKRNLNNSEYIPYSKLTIGGVNVEDIEKEISNIPNKDVPLSPIIDKILSSRENSPRKERHEINSRTFTTSDENLLQEVMNIEKTISETLSKNIQKQKDNQENSKDVDNDTASNKTDSYADDFEDDIDQKEHSSEQSPKSTVSFQIKDLSGKKSKSNSYQSNDEATSDQNKPSTSKIHNRTYTKASNLSFKDSVDVFEFIHSIDTQDTGTQSNSLNRILPKETQTSPRNDRANIQPIHNDLRQSIDPRKEVEKMFELEKDIIKKLIIEEYGDILEKNLTKSSNDNDNNVAASQKNTQTSPTRVKSVMTSPRRTKTRTTSPFPLSVTLDKQTSPLIFESNIEEASIVLENDDLGISINLSSPRFSLRLPQTTREVLSNLDACTNTSRNNIIGSKTTRKSTISSSSVDADNSSSELSSLGEVKMKFKKKLRLLNRSISSESSSSTVSSKSSSDLASGGILPLKSEGEVSLGRPKQT